jgi:hypothetical protein
LRSGRRVWLRSVESTDRERRGAVDMVSVLLSAVISSLVSGVALLWDGSSPSPETGHDHHTGGNRCFCLSQVNAG